MSGRVVTFGEIMLRLKSPGFERLMQSPVLEATFGGGEANVAVSLAQFGLDVSYVTAPPNIYESVAVKARQAVRSSDPPRSKPVPPETSIRRLAA